MKNEATPRDFLQKWKVECRADGLVPMRFAVFPLHLSKEYGSCHEKGMPGHTKRLHLSRKIIFSKPEDLMLQNATPLRKSAPGPPNSSDEHVSCTAPAMENASLQILFKCPTTASVFGNATKSSRFCSLLIRCTIPCASHAKRHLNVKKGSEHVVLYCVFNMFTSKCALRHNGMHFFDISTSKSAPNPSVFYTFDLEMCFAPQRRALVRHRNFQKCSDAEVFCTFWLGNVLRATTACTFSTSQLLKVLRSWGALYILTSKCASRHNRVQFFISHLAGWLRTRRFSEPIFQPSGATNHWKNAVFRDFPTFSRTWIFFLLRLSLFGSSFFFSSLLWLFPSLLFICPYVSRASLVVMSSSSQQHYEQEQFASGSSIEKSNSSGTREFTGENAIGPETLRLFG